MASPQILSLSPKRSVPLRTGEAELPDRWGNINEGNFVVLYSVRYPSMLFAAHAAYTKYARLELYIPISRTRTEDLPAVWPAIIPSRACQDLRLLMPLML
jgi:hypothetical protein